MGFVSSGFDMIQSLGSPRAGFFLTVASSNNLKPILNQNFDDGESRIFLQQSWSKQIWDVLSQPDPLSRGILRGHETESWAQAGVHVCLLLKIAKNTVNYIYKGVGTHTIIVL